MRGFELSIVAFCLLCACGGLPLQAQDLSTPETTVRSFLTAFTVGDLKKAAACVEGVNYDAADYDIARAIKKLPARYRVGSVQVHIVGDIATVSIVGSAMFPHRKAVQYHSVVKLHGSIGRWHIFPVRDEKLALADSEDVVRGFAWELTNPKAAVRNLWALQSASCVSNLKQLALGALQLVRNHNQKFAFNAENFKNAMLPYVKNEQIFSCPTDNNGIISYSFNPHIAGVSLGHMADPTKTVMLYEGKAGKLNFRHEGKAAVAFADGHAILVTENDLKKLRWMP